MPRRRILPLGGGVIVGVWVVMLVATPYVASHDHLQRAGAVAVAAMYVAGSVVCHQQPARSFHVWGTQMPVCARCTGLYALAPSGFMLAPGGGWLGARRRRPSRRGVSIHRLRTVLLATAVPMLVTVGGEWAGLMYPPNLVRAVAGLPLGLTVAWVAGLALVGAIDETEHEG